MFTFHHDLYDGQKLREISPYFVETSDHKTLEVVKHVALRTVQEIHVVLSKLERCSFKIDTPWRTL